MEKSIKGITSSRYVKGLFVRFSYLAGKLLATDDNLI